MAGGCCPLAGGRVFGQAQWQQGLALLSATLGAQLEPNSSCYTLISTCENGGQGQRQPALARLSEALGAKLEPSIICSRIPITACEKSGQWE